MIPASRMCEFGDYNDFSVRLSIVDGQLDGKYYTVFKYKRDDGLIVTYDCRYLNADPKHKNTMYLGSHIEHCS